MAHKIEKSVLLGYEEEPITDAYSSTIGYWTNKIGGLPDWPVKGLTIPQCQLCSLPQLLITQVYAPLEASPYHRTLYLFCCINPNCWNLSQSWTCWRCQVLDEDKPSNVPSKVVREDWCAGANDWGDDDDNGNVVPSTTDSDDSSSLSTSFGALNVDQCNANLAQRVFGAAGKISPTAEIEGEEGEVVTIDTPTAPRRDLRALLEATAPLPKTLSAFFLPFFISVFEESVSNHWGREKELLEEYTLLNGEVVAQSGAVSSGAGSVEEEEERYERSVPLHGDAMFHEFVTRVQENPGHILRYSRGSSPLLMAPLEVPKTCRHCRGALVFEMQIVPTLLTKLKIPGDSDLHLEFGTVLVYSCRDSCWKEGDVFKEEVVCVQAEDDCYRQK